MKPYYHSGKSRFASRKGMALVIVLGMLILMLGLTLAFFSRAALQRQISQSSSSNARVESLALAGTEYIISDLLQEIQAGSEIDPLPSVTRHIETPITVSTNGIRYAPSMVPQKVGHDGIANIVKKSTRDKPVFDSALPGYRSAVTGMTRASAVATTDPSRKGRKVTLARWNMSRLMSDADMASFTAPDWIYLDRQGNNPRSFTTAEIPTLSSPKKTNNSYVVGRYAYVIFDEGGLININVVGNGLPTADNARRGRLHQISLANGIGDITLPKFSEFVTWRWPQSKTNASDSDGGLFDPKRTFLKVAKGDQTFLNRQDLINFSLRDDSLLPPAALPFLTTFGRDVDAPSHAPAPDRPLLPVAPPPNENESEVDVRAVRRRNDTGTPGGRREGTRRYARHAAEIPTG